MNICFTFITMLVPVQLQLSEDLSLKKGVATFKIYLVFPHVSYTEEEFLYLYSQTNPQHLVQRNAAAVSKDKNSWNITGWTHFFSSLRVELEYFWLYDVPTPMSLWITMNIPNKLAAYTVVCFLQIWQLKPFRQLMKWHPGHCNPWLLPEK